VEVATDEITWSEQLYRIYELEIGVPVTVDLIRTRVHPEDVSLLDKMKMVDQAGGGTDEFEWQYRLMMPDHSIKYMHAIAHVTHGENGHREYIAAVQDVTKRRLSEAGLVKQHSDEARLMEKRSLVSIVDDDESVRESLPDLLRQLGFAAEAFSSAEAFLASDVINETSCLLLDISMPGMSGPDLQQELAHRRQTIPVVFITANGDPTIRSHLLAKGAIECLFKPFSETALVDALNAALQMR
jgi:CheY-like chemotaxis protein